MRKAAHLPISSAPFCSVTAVGRTPIVDPHTHTVQVTAVRTLCGLQISSPSSLLSPSLALFMPLVLFLCLAIPGCARLSGLHIAQEPPEGRGGGREMCVCVCVWWSGGVSG